MITLFRSEKKYALGNLKQAVEIQLKLASKNIAVLGDSQSVIRYEFDVEDINILGWLHNQRVDEKVYWSDRNSIEEIAGIGCAKEINIHKYCELDDAFERIHGSLSKDNARLRYFGGFCFNDVKNSLEWASYGVGKFIIPQFEFLNLNGQCMFAVNLAVRLISEENIFRLINDLKNISLNKATEYRSPPIVQARHDCPDKLRWAEKVNEIKKDIVLKNLTKAVLARKSVFNFDKYINPIALIKHLKDNTPQCYHFCFQINDKSGFLGASPERLVKRVGDFIESEAIAGTNTRGQNDEEDHRLEMALMNSKKDIYEHECVVKSIVSSFENLCESYQKDSGRISLNLKGSRHLMTGFKGSLKRGVSNAAVISSIHPTPAVGGAPKNEAIDMINRLEDFDRGWYAGPVGFVGYDTMEFAVAIRSALIEDNCLALFAGAGVVSESNATEEWEEVENKISRFIKVFDLGVRV